MIKFFKNLFLFIFGTILFAILGIVFINLFVVLSTNEYVLNENDASNLHDVDCILVLGAAAWGKNPSPMLEDRLLKGIELYNLKASPKLLMSGDHGTKYYDEVNLMKQYAKDKGIPSEDIFMDHAGFSTYDSMYRAKEIFGTEKIIIVTQRYHLSRAVYIARAFGIDAYGVSTDNKQYSGQIYRDVREIVARVKDFAWSIWKPYPKLLGEKIAIDGNGDVTNDKD